ncbi:MAG: hypothetical protein K9J76_10205 [Polaromonas sp.]|nr:hypothetical protein [Polaromonas sp.]
MTDQQDFVTGLKQGAQAFFQHEPNLVSQLVGVVEVAFNFMGGAGDLLRQEFYKGRKTIAERHGKPVDSLVPGMGLAHLSPGWSVACHQSFDPRRINARIPMLVVEKIIPPDQVKPGKIQL